MPTWKKSFYLYLLTISFILWGRSCDEVTVRIFVFIWPWMSSINVEQWGKKYYFTFFVLKLSVIRIIYFNFLQKLSKTNYKTKRKLSLSLVSLKNVCASPQTENRTDKTQSPPVGKQSLTNLPIRRNSPATPSRLMAMSRPRTVMPSQKQTTTRAFGRRSRSFLSSLSKCFSPALL